MIYVYFGVNKTDLGSFSITDKGLEQLSVAAEERLQHRVVFLHRELPPGGLRASLQSAHILQDAVKRNYQRKERDFSVISKFN